MKRTQVKSSNLISIGYDEDTKTLEIEYHNGGVYQYFNVQPKVYARIMVAPSIGRFFHQVIKPNYSYKKVDQLED